MINNGTKTGQSIVEAHEFFNPYLYAMLTQLPVLLVIIIFGVVVLYALRRFIKK